MKSRRTPGVLNLRFLVLLGCALTAVPASAQSASGGEAKGDSQGRSLLERARGLRKEGKFRAAAGLYRHWLSGAEVSSDAAAGQEYAAVLMEYAEVEPDIRAAEQVLEAGLARVHVAEARARLLGTLARLLELSGDVQGALNRYEEAAGIGASPVLLLRLARLLYEEGRRGDAQRWLDRLRGGLKELKNRPAESARSGSSSGMQTAEGRNPELDDSLAAQATLLEARLAGDRGDFQRAIVLLAALETSGPSGWAPAAALELVRIYLRSGEAEKARALRGRMEQRWSDTPETRLAGLLIQEAPGPDSTVESVFRPSVVLGGTLIQEKRPEVTKAGSGRTPVARVALPPGARAAGTLGALEENSPAVESEPSQRTPLSPQGGNEQAASVVLLAGSYQSERNAESRVRELQGKGLRPRIVAARVAGRLYYRVLVGEAGTYDEVAERMLRLKEKHVESVPLFLPPKTTTGGE